MSSAADLPQGIAPIIFGCTGPELTADERAFFRDAMPAGFILFQKNCVDADQIRALTNDLRVCVGWHAPVLVDQEGGRVQRLKPPQWPSFPAWKPYGDLYARDPAAATRALQQAVEGLAAVQCPLGMDVDCVPVLDIVPQGQESRVINDRSLGADIGAVATLGLAACRAAVASGMTPVMKHMPGHGRAVADSHHELPVVTASRTTLEQSDFIPFRHVARGMGEGTLWGMTAHVIYTAIDPDLPGTLSPTVINDVIRADIGFDGLLVSDDLFMKALDKWGDVPQRAALALKAGVDLALPCHGTVAERAAMRAAIPAMSAQTRTRLENWAATRTPVPARKPVETLLSEVAMALRQC